VICNRAPSNDAQEDDWDDRCKTVNEAVSDGDPEDDEEEEEDEDQEDRSDDENPFPSWLTLIDQNGKVRHRRLNQISQDLMTADTKAVQVASKLKAAEVPAEREIQEGMWIHIPKRQIGVWGNQSMAMAVPRMQKAWRGWTVNWSDGGYADQCQISGVPGVRMTDTEALVPFMGNVLSVQRFDAGMFLGAIQTGIKKTAMKVTGCLLLVLAVPFLVFGYFADRIQAAALAYVALVIVVVILFNVIAFKLKKRFSLDNIGRREAPDKKPAVAGPLDMEERREQMNRLLAACGFPSLEEMQPAMSKVPNLDDLSKV
jgi:hypothetical protein